MSHPTTTPKTIQLFLMDGTSQGRLKATLSNWTGITYLLPRTMLQRSKDRADLQQTGVYLLFGVDDDGSERVYIGQARERKNQNGVLGRLIEHTVNNSKDYWTHAIVLVTSNNSFGPTEISYLENRFVTLARESKRYEIDNGNEPSAGNVTEEKQTELEDFITSARLVVGSLGYPVFEPLTAPETTVATDSLHSDGGSAGPLLEMKYATASATGRQTADGFVVYAGSQLRPESEFAPSLKEGTRKLRQKHADKIGVDYRLTTDLLLNSPSGAANFVGGASLNGFVTWRDSAGIPLSELERSASEQSA